MHRFAVPMIAFLAALAAASSAHALESRVLTSSSVDYRVVTLDLASDALDLYWRDEGGRPYASIEALRRLGESRHTRLRFATNAGMYDHEFRPLGLTIAGGRTLRKLNVVRSTSSSANFAIPPNGVFYVDAGGHAGIVPTRDWSARGIDARVATQSGPMLVIDGEINPAFIEASDSRKWRSGVCAPTPDHATFAVSESPVTFHEFARVFRDEIGCRDALYLDGSLSQIFTDGNGYSGAPPIMIRPYAGILAVFAADPSADAP